MIEMGIYEVKNIVNNKRYIGSSTQIKERRTAHFSNLRNGRHPNKHLQADWDMHGESNFVFNILEPIKNKDVLLIREGYWINKLRSNSRNNGYNIHGLDKNGKTILPENLIREIVESANPLMGNNHPNAKLTEEDVVDITSRMDGGELALDLSREYEVDVSVIYGIANNETWKSVRRKVAKKHHHDKKLTPDDVANIKIALSKNTSTRELADKHKVHIDTIYAIKQGVNWSHILPELDLSGSNNRLAPKRKKIHRDQVVQIKTKIKQGESAKSIARKFSVTVNTIYDIKNEKSWTDVHI